MSNIHITKIRQDKCHMMPDKPCVLYPDNIFLMWTPSLGYEMWRSHDGQTGKTGETCWPIGFFCPTAIGGDWIRDRAYPGRDNKNK